MKRFKSSRHAQRFLSAFSGISAHFRPRRHLLSATEWRTEMADRFTVWRQVTAPDAASNRQYLWIKIFYAASSVAVVSSGRSTSLPFSNFAPARTSATRWGALTARQRDWAASISL